MYINWDWMLTCEHMPSSLNIVNKTHKISSNYNCPTKVEQNDILNETNKKFVQY